MKNNILTACFILFAGMLFGQTEKENYKTVLNNFEKQYNANNYDSRPLT